MKYKKILENRFEAVLENIKLNTMFNICERKVKRKISSGGPTFE